MRIIRQETHSSGVSVDFCITETGHPYVITRFDKKCPYEVRQVFKSIERFINADYLRYQTAQTPNEPLN